MAYRGSLGDLIQASLTYENFTFGVEN